MSRKQYLSGFIILAAFFMLLYARTLSYEFLDWDDDVLVKNNMAIRAFTMSNIAEMFSGEKGLYIPMIYLSFALDYSIYGLDPWGFRLTNFIYHILNMGLVFYLFQYFIDRRKFSSSQIWIGAITVALLWGIHPLRIESVVWVTERKDVLSGFLTLLSLLFYVKYKDRQDDKDIADTKQSQWLMPASILCYVLALLSKPSMLPFPAILILLDFYPHKKISFSKDFIKSFINSCLDKSIYIALSLLAAFGTFYTTINAQALAPTDFYPYEFRVTNSIYSLSLYLFNTLFPFNLQVFYPKQSYSLVDPLIISTTLTITLALFFIFKNAIQKSRYQELVIFGSFMIVIFPMLGMFVVGTHGAADRYTYLSTIPLFYWLGGLILIKINKKWLWFAVGAWTLCLMGKTITQQPVWKNSEVFFNQYLGSSTQALGLINLGIYYSNNEEYEKAEGIFLEALTKDPNDSKAYNSLGVLYSDIKQYDKAINAYAKAITLDPGFSEVYHNLGNAYMEISDYARAEAAFKKALTVNPKLKQTRGLLGDSLFKQGKHNEAMEAYNDSIKHFPEGASGYNGMGVILAARKDFDQAMSYYNKAMKLEPDSASLLYNIGNIYMDQNRNQEAEEHFLRALKSDPELTEAYKNLGHVYTQRGEMQKALSTYLKAAELASNDSASYHNLANVYYLLKNFSKADEQIKKALEIKPVRDISYKLQKLISEKLVTENE